MAMVRKKQDDKYLEALRELITKGAGNRQCFDCGQKGPTYVNMTIGSFVCTRCSGVLRGLTPPHRVKSISMATFTQEEIDFLKAHGNELCGKTWLGLWDPKRAVHQDQRELMIDKYERKRYFLEPASPLKSLTNATILKTSSSSSSNVANSSNASNNATTNTQQRQNNSSSNSSNNISNGHGNGNNNTTSQIHLTPPTSQRTTANGLHKSSSSAISRPQHHSTPQQQQQQQQLQNGFNTSVHTDAFGLHTGLNTSVGSASTGALSDTSSCASANGFGAEADFVADFGSADIFNATVASSPASSVASSTTNGYAKIQSLKQQQFMNGSASLTNGSATTNGNTENFADFDHAPIYNAAGLPIPNGFNSKNSTITNGFNSSSNNNNNNNNNNINNLNNNNSHAEDRYAALKDLDEQLRESKAVAAQAASIVTQTVVESGFGNPNNNAANTINPFQHQQQLQQQQPPLANPFQSGIVNNTNTTQLFGQMTLIPNGIATSNGFLNTQKPQANTGFFNYTANGFTTNNIAALNAQHQQQQHQQHHHIQQQQQQQYPNQLSAGPNGCGFGFGSMQQQQMLTTAGSALTANSFNNPFAANGALNSNNPFL